TRNNCCSNDIIVSLHNRIALHIGCSTQKEESNRSFKKIYGRFREEKRFGQFTEIRQIYDKDVDRKLILA
ncbi:MAG: hypothetical protein WAM88_11645, partial [Nitrososphaeraceae archaeon]